MVFLEDQKTYVPTLFHGIRIGCHRQGGAERRRAVAESAAAAGVRRLDRGVVAVQSRCQDGAKVRVSDGQNGQTGRPRPRGVKAKTQLEGSLCGLRDNNSAQRCACDLLLGSWDRRGRGALNLCR
jgi:hypothetical protein